MFKQEGEILCIAPLLPRIEHIQLSNIFSLYDTVMAAHTLTKNEIK